MEIAWEDDASISASSTADTTVITANRAGLVSLARIMLALADEMPGTHLHLDANNSLEDGSCELIIERVP